MQFLWWEILLVKHSNAVISLKQNIAALSSSDEQIIKRDIEILQQHKAWQVYMIVGEGTVFLLILLYGVYQVRKSIKNETELGRQKNNFVSSISHELKTPIAATKLQLQTLLKHDLERNKQIEFLESALKETNRLQKLVENILFVNQLENTLLHAQKQVFNLSELIEDIVQRYFLDYYQNKKINLHITKNLSYNGDKEMISSIIINLIENAIKYSFDKITVDIELIENNNKIELTVKDNGSGIEDSDKIKIFQKFYRTGNENTRKTKGTGLGLYIVKSICDLHQINISVKNNTPNGTVFKLIF
jgi:two-component system phosphate regulon sensor histidine kinase PhoR